MYEIQLQRKSTIFVWCVYRKAQYEKPKKKMVAAEVEHIALFAWGCKFNSGINGFNNKFYKSLR